MDNPKLQFDVIGLGALNVDYIASASSLSKRTADRVTESLARFEGNVEGPMAEDAILGVVDQLGAASLQASLGGSAWNTIFALAQLRIGLRLGYVGMLGQIGMLGVSFTHQMDQFEVDHRWVGTRSERPSGMCLSYLDDGDRTLLTCPGANLDMGDHLREHREDIANYLASSRFVHVTSLLDPVGPAEQLAVLLRAKAINPGMRISLDPGYDWALNPTSDILDILRISDYVFVNFREFRALGSYRHGQLDADVARTLLARCGPEATVFVTKRYDFVEVFRAARGSIRAEQFRLALPPDPEAELEDATGAGDVFSGAVLAALTSHEIQAELGSLLGLSLVRHKLRHSQPPDLADGYLRIRESLVLSRISPRGIYLSHDGSGSWTDVRDFIERDCRLTVFEHGVVGPGGCSAEYLRAALAQCSFAVCLLSVSAATLDGGGRAHQDVVHQAGIFQGRYGFSRVALLVEDGCEVFSNAAGLIQLPFVRNHVDATFLELERILRRECLLTEEALA